MQTHKAINAYILKPVLDRFYKEYELKDRIIYDPVDFPHRYKKPEDIEVAGFIASCFAYGRVDLFKPVVERMLSLTEGSPYAFFSSFDIRKQSSLFNDIKYRMNKTSDIFGFFHLLSLMLTKYHTIGEFFKYHYKNSDESIVPVLSKFVNAFYRGDTTNVYGKQIYPFGLKQLLPSPDKGSTCKRANMFLRWMVRYGDAVDFGLWRFIPRNKLIIPLDTHISRIARHLLLTERKTTDLKTAIEITDNLKLLDSDDPVKYDFALCHLGISGKCPSNRSDSSCMVCVLKDVCIV